MVHLHRTLPHHPSPFSSQRPLINLCWWFQPIWKMLVKLDPFPQTGMKINKYLSCHHPVKSDVSPFNSSVETEKPQTPSTATGTGCEVTTRGAQAWSGLAAAKGGTKSLSKRRNTWSDGSSGSKIPPKIPEFAVWVIPFPLLDWK